MEIHPIEHNYYLNLIKKLLKASFVGWVKDKENKYLKIVINKNTISLPFEGGDILGKESYINLINNIIKAHGGKSQETVQLSEQESGVETVNS